MSSQQSTVDFLLEKISQAGNVRYRKMFGEYAVYCDQKVVALVCDDQLYVKPTDQGRALLQEVVEESPYPGAKPYFLITADLWDDDEWLTELVHVTAAALPLPKKNKV